MKRRDLERHLRDHGCRQIDEGANHARWAAPTGKRRSAVPRHREIDRLARSICKVQKKIGPAWTRRRRPEAGYFTKRTAQAWLDGRLAKAGSGELAGMVRTNLTFEEAAGEWLRYVEHERAVKPGTLKGYRIMVDVLMEDLEGVPIGREPPRAGGGGRCR